MKYLVLYKTEIVTGATQYRSSEITFTAQIPTWEMFDNKKEAVACAVGSGGVIVEAFEFDIKKEAKK